MRKECDIETPKVGPIQAAASHSFINGRSAQVFHEQNRFSLLENSPGHPSGGLARAIVKKWILLLALALLTVILWTQKLNGNRFHDIRGDVQPHPTRFFSPVPGMSVRHSHHDFQVDVRINSHGYREREIPEKKPAGALRVAAVGDSFTFGWGVREEQTFSRRIESILNSGAASRTAQTLNFGVWMYAFDQQLVVLKEDALRWNPDLVMVGVYPAHVYTILPHEVKRDADGRIVAVQPPNGEGGGTDASEPSRFKVKRPSSSPFGVLKNALGRSRRNAPYDDIYELYMPDKRKKWEVAWEKTFEAIRQEKEAADIAGARFLLFVIPASIHFTHPEWRKQFVGKGERVKYETRLPHERFRRFAEKEGILFLDLLPGMLASGKTDLYYRRDLHWTPKGHELAARLLADFIEKNRLLKR